MLGRKLGGTLRIGLIVALLCMFLPIRFGSSASAAVDSGWPMFRHDPQHSGFAPEVEIAPPLFLHFKIDLGAASDSTPAVINGRLYIGDEDGVIHCYNADNGEEIWSKSGNAPIKSSPAVFDGKVYYGDEDGKFFCLSAETGKIEWKYQVGDKIESSPLVADINGKKLVFFGSSDRTVYCLNAGSGKMVWQYTTGGSIYSSPALYKQNVIIGSGDGNLYCFNGESGKIVWVRRLTNTLKDVSDKIYSSPAVDVSKQLVFVGSYNHYFYALNVETGIIEYYADMGKEIYASPVICNNRVVCTAVNKVVCFDEGQLNEEWMHTFSGTLFSSPASAFGYLFVSEKNGGFSCLNMQTGESEWNFKVKSSSKSGPVPANGHIYFFGGKNIFAFTSKENAAKPILQVFPASIDFGKVTKGTKSTQYLYLKNINRDVLTNAIIGNLEGSVTTKTDWISVDPSYFESNSQTVIVTIDTSNLMEGKSYYGEIYVKTNGGNATVSVNVSIKQSSLPVISTTVSKIDFGEINEGESPKTTFYIENSHRDLTTGEWIGLLKGTIKSDKTWITVAPLSFESNKQLVSVSVDSSSFEEGKSYTGFINIKSNGGNVSIPVSVRVKQPKIVITLQPNNPIMTVNGVKKEIDPGRGTKPVIIKEWGRTVVPIRAIVEALGGTISWDGTERKVTINLKDTVIELWIGKPKAKVNGIEKWIDPNNHNVKPIIVNQRTMLPLRFVAESLGAKVDWDASTKTITITYPAP